MTPLLLRLRQNLEELREQPWHEYTVPGRWVGSTQPVRFANAPSYFLHQLDAVELVANRRPRAVWSATDITYNGLVRHITAYDHGKGAAEDGWRVTGSFLKLLSLLPYLRALGVSTLCLLPITEIGEVGRKGNVGSPYAVRHPFRIDPSLAETHVAMSVDDQCRCLIETCHLLGMKVIVEVVLRTAAIDSDMVLHHPEWFYWIDQARLEATGAPFSAPSFNDSELISIKERVTVKNFKNLPEPHEDYQALFDSPPHKIEHDEHGWKGIKAKGLVVRIPGAFADWPPDDPQPAWSDVTYLRLHDHSHYRYMAYNTVRMFERSLDVPQYRNHALWNTIAGIIPHSIRTLNIDGALIDMGHALPADLRQRVIHEARQQNQQLMLWEETFELTAASKVQGYDGVVGYMPFEAHAPERLRAFVRRVAQHNIPVSWYAAAETHNTPRAASRVGGRDFSAAVWTVLRTLPTGIPFVCAGFELGETTPINTGLGFTDSERENYPDEKLPLFSDVRLDWDTSNTVDVEMRAFEHRLRTSSWYAIASNDDVVVPIEVTDSNLVAFIRYTRASRRGIVVVANIGAEEINVGVNVPKNVHIALIEPNDTVKLHADNHVEIRLKPWSSKMCFCVMNRMPS
ncbi:MAG: alpha-amylase [bacterium]|nr:alpha-amylase [bacterium]